MDTDMADLVARDTMAVASTEALAVASTEALAVDTREALAVAMDRRTCTEVVASTEDTARASEDTARSVVTDTAISMVMVDTSLTATE